MSFLEALAAWVRKNQSPWGRRRPPRTRARQTVRLGVEVLEDRLVLAVSPATVYQGISFQNLSKAGSVARAIPDTNVAVGVNYVGEATNDGVRFINKATGAVVTENFEQVFGPHGNGAFLDPTLNYDESTGNFILTTLNGAADPVNSALDFAVASDQNPTLFQHITFVPLNAPRAANPTWGDFDQVGWNKDAYFVSMNRIAGNTTDTNFVNVLTIRKSDFAVFPLVRVPHWTNPTAFNLVVQPAVMHGDTQGGAMWFVGTPLPAAPKGILGDDVNVGGGAIDVIQMTYSTLGVPTFTNHPVAVDPWVVTPNAQQKGTRVSLDVGDTRVLKAAWRNNRLVATQTVGLTVDTQAHTRWYEFSTAGAAPTLTQQQTLAPGPRVNTWGASIAIDAAGDLGMTYLEASTSEFMSMYVTGQAAGMTGSGMEPGRLVQASVGPYTFGGDPNNTLVGARTGDVSGVAVDPVTGAFWAANEYTAVSPAQQATDQWDTKIAQFTLKAPYRRTAAVTFGIAPDHTLWEYTNGSAWTQISTGNFLSISASTDANGAPKVYGIVSDHTLWAWQAATGAWSELSNGYFQSISADPGGLVFAVVQDGPVNDLWEYNGSAWAKLSTGNFTSLSAGEDAQGNPIVYGIVSNGNLWAWQAATGWTLLSSGNFLSVSADNAGDVVGTLVDNSVWEYSMAYGGSNATHWKDLRMHMLAVSAVRG